MEKSDNTKNLALLANNEINVSVLEVAAEGVRVKLWPNADAVRAHLEEATARLPGGLKGYSVRHYVCGRYLYCAIALGDITKDAPCPASYQVNTDSYLNEAEGSLVAAAAEWSIGKGVLALPPLRISKDRVQINYTLPDRLTVADIRYNDDYSVAAVQLRKASDGGLIEWQAK